MQILDEIIDKYDDMMRCYALSITKDESLADDIVQDCYLKIINNALLIKQLKSSQVRSWLFKVIKNILIDKKRKEKLLNIVSDVQEKSNFNPELEVYVEQLLDKLDEEEREIVHCRYWLGMNSKEVAKELEVPASTVRWKLTKILKKLRMYAGERKWNTDY